jgi:peptidyl-tRNA hydrolase, PTH1 family
MYLIVGLGNPGKDYSGSRHNLGFQVVEYISKKIGAVKPNQKHWSLIAETTYKRRKVMLAQPLTYMNLSGRAVKELMRNYRVDVDRLLVIYDELDLPAGTIRLRGKGGSAGHRGIQSIIDALGTSEFSRLRIGIDRAPEGMEPSDYVLLPVEGQDKIVLEQAVARSAEAALLFVEQGLEAAMNSYNNS